MTDLTHISQLKLGDADKVIEAKVYRTWTSKRPRSTTPTGFCCILIDRDGAAIQANMDHNHTEYFKTQLELQHAYMISKFYVERPQPGQQAISREISLSFDMATVFTTINPVGYPEKFFELTGYDDINIGVRTRPFMTDYLACIKSIGSVKTVAQGTKNEAQIRTIELIDLSDNIIQLTLWNDFATSFKINEYESLPKPVLFAVTSCWAKPQKYGPGPELSNTSATHYYFNPPVPEFEDLMTAYKMRFAQHNFLQVTDVKYELEEKERHRNYYPLNKLLEQNPKNYNFVRFTCDGILTSIDSTREWYYRSCTDCSKKVDQIAGKERCRLHGEQPTPKLTYSVKTSITDGTAQATFTLFNEGGEKLIKHTCYELVEQLGYHNSHVLPQEVQSIVGSRKIFQFRFNQTSTSRIPEFVLDNYFEPDIPQLQRLRRPPSTMAKETATETVHTTAGTTPPPSATPQKIIAESSRKRSLPFEAGTEPITINTGTTMTHETADKELLPINTPQLQIQPPKVLSVTQTIAKEPGTSTTPPPIAIRATKTSMSQKTGEEPQKKHKSKQA